MKAAAEANRMRPSTKRRISATGEANAGAEAVCCSNRNESMIKSLPPHGPAIAGPAAGGCGRPARSLIGVTGKQRRALFSNGGTTPVLHMKTSQCKPAVNASASEAGRRWPKGEVDAISSDIVETIKLYEQSAATENCLGAGLFQQPARIAGAPWHRQQRGTGVESGWFIAGGTLDTLAVYLALQRPSCR